MDIIRSILMGVLVPLCISGVFVLMSVLNARGLKSHIKNQLVVQLPSFTGTIGLFGAFLMIGITILLSVVSSPTPHPVFYVLMSVLTYMSLFLFLKAKFWRITVEDNIINVHPIVKKPYSFHFQDIIFVKRQVKQNRVNSERVVIKTSTGKKVIAESAELGYEQLVKLIVERVDNQFLEGFWA